jgi:hypothetical protein
MPMLVIKPEIKNQHCEKSIQNAIFQKKILTILTTAMSKRRGNSLMLARLTMPLEGNICIQRGAFFVKTVFFAEKHSTLMYWQVFITCLITSSLVVECNC